MTKIIRLTEADLVRIIGKLINENPIRSIIQKSVRPTLNTVRGQGGKQISKTAKLGQDIERLRKLEKEYYRDYNVAETLWRSGDLSDDQFRLHVSFLQKKYNLRKNDEFTLLEPFRQAQIKRYNSLQAEKNKIVVANTPQEKIIKSKYQVMRKNNISQGGSSAEGVFDLGNGYVAKVSKLGWDDAGIQNLKWKDKIKSPRVMKLVQVISFPDATGKEIVYQVHQKATGTPLDKIIKSNTKIPIKHKENFKKDLEELYRNNVFVDENPENFLYDPNKGIQFIDLGRNEALRTIETPRHKPDDVVKRVWLNIDTY